MSTIVNLANPSDSAFYRNRYILSFGAYGDTLVMAYASSLESALEECAEWLSTNAPGHIMKFGSDEHKELINEAMRDAGLTYTLESADHEDPDFLMAVDSAESDLTHTEAGFLTSYEWGIVLDCPDRKELVRFLKGRDAIIKIS